MQSPDKPDHRLANARQRREAARMIEFLGQAGHQKKRRKPASLEEYESLLRLAGKEQRAKGRNDRRDSLSSGRQTIENGGALRASEA